MFPVCSAISAMSLSPDPVSLTSPQAGLSRCRGAGVGVGRRSCLLKMASDFLGLFEVDVSTQLWGKVSLCSLTATRTGRCILVVLEEASGKPLLISPEHRGSSFWFERLIISYDKPGPNPQGCK